MPQQQQQQQQKQQQQRLPSSLSYNSEEMVNWSSSIFSNGAYPRQ